MPVARFMELISQIMVGRDCLKLKRNVATVFRSGQIRPRIIGLNDAEDVLIRSQITAESWRAEAPQ